MLLLLEALTRVKAGQESLSKTRFPQRHIEEEEENLEHRAKFDLDAEEEAA